MPRRLPFFLALLPFLIGITSAETPGDSFTQISPTDQERFYLTIIEAGSSYVRISSRGDVEVSDDAGVTWTDRSPGLLQPLNDIAYTGSHLVAVGDAGVIITSDDMGLNWQNRQSGSTSWLYSVAWTGSHVLACGANGLITISANHGATWDHAFWSYSDGEGGWLGFGQLNAAAGIASGWAVAGSGGRVFISADQGVNWVIVRNPASGSPDIHDFIYTGSEFVAVGSEGLIVRATHLAEDAWTVIPSGTTATLFDVFWNGIRAFASGGTEFGNFQKPKTLLSSDDHGQSWITRISEPGDSLRGTIGTTTDMIAVGTAPDTWRSVDGGIIWQKDTTALSAPTGDFNRVIETQGLVVGVGDGGLINTSADGGRSWNERSGGTTRDLYDVLRTGDRLVVAGLNGTILVSDDEGATWQSRPSGIPDHLAGLAHTGNHLIAVGGSTDFSSAVALYSTDAGDTWSTATIAGSRLLLRAHWDGTRLIAAGLSGDVAYSDDEGETWTASGQAGNENIFSLASAPGYILATNGGGSCYRSTDHGATWQPAATNGSVSRFNVDHLVFDAGVWYAVDSNGLLISDDGGINWRDGQGHFASGGASLFGAGGRLVLISETFGSIYWSDDGGASWGGYNVQTIRHITAITKLGRRHIATGESNQIMYSDDNGQNWHFVTPPGPDHVDWLDVIVTPGERLLAVGEVGSVASSNDGAVWELEAFPSTSRLYAVAAGGGRLVAVGEGGSIFISADDGESWTAQSSGVSGFLTGISYGAGLFAAVGFSGTILTSPDGIAWTLRTSNTTEHLRDITWQGQRFIAVGGGFNEGTILTSPDGVSWTARATDLSDQIEAVTTLGARAVAMGAFGRATSDDGGLTWSYQQGATLFINALHWDGKTLLAGGSNENLWYSEGDAAGLLSAGLAPDIAVDDPHGLALASGIGSTNLGRSAPGTPGAPTTFTIRNDGNSYLDGIFGEIASPSGGSFVIDASALPTGLFPGEIAALAVTLTPDAVDLASATLNINSNDSDESPFTVTLSGSGVTATTLFASAMTAAGLSGADATPGAQPFHDGVANLLKYAFNIPLGTPAAGTPLPPDATSGLPAITLVENAGQFSLRFVFLRHRGSGIVYSALVSATLKTASFTTASGIPSVETIDANWERVTIDHPCNPLATAGCFGRVLVSLP